jgi:hypothetical protein
MCFHRLGSLLVPVPPTLLKHISPFSLILLASSCAYSCLGSVGGSHCCGMKMFVRSVATARAGSASSKRTASSTRSFGAPHSPRGLMQWHRSVPSSRCPSDSVRLTIAMQEDRATAGTNGRRVRNTVPLYEHGAFAHASRRSGAVDLAFYNVAWNDCNVYESHRLVWMGWR